MPTLAFWRQIPKVELHVHLEGSIPPKTLLALAKRNGVDLPAKTEAEIADWYRFRDFPHFVEVYVAASKCIRSAGDLEFVARGFLDGQAAQNILHSEVTYSASTIRMFTGIGWAEQMEAIGRAIAYGEQELGVTMSLITDIIRGKSVAEAMELAELAVSYPQVCALGVAGEESRGTVQYADAYRYAHNHGVPVVAHAGETCGPQSIRETLEYAKPVRIGHGVRCVEDPRLVREFAASGIPLEVCPSSNVALGIFPSLAEHPFPRMLDEGLNVSINSDDPPMFSTSLSEEFARCAEAFDLNEDIAWSLCLNAANASLLSTEKKQNLITRMRTGFTAAVEAHP
jgi:adenosine deaminase